MPQIRIDIVVLLSRFRLKKYEFNCYIWRPPSLSELTPIIFITGLTHLGSEASIESNNIPTQSQAHLSF